MSIYVTMQWLMLGMITGLLVTVFDCLFMFIPDIHVPHSYPFSLIFINVLFWMIIGLVSGGIFSVCAGRTHFKERLQRYGAICFLTCFAFIYGLLGRFYISPHLSYDTMIIANSSAFDYHLSFAWVAFILASFIFYCKRRSLEWNNSLPALVLTVITIIILFQLCTNIAQIQFINKLYLRYQTFLEQLHLRQSHYLIVMYCFGVTVTGTLYFLYMRKPTFAITYGSFSIAIALLLVISVIITGFFVQKNLSQREKTSLIKTVLRDKDDPAKTPNVMLIILDTVRADRLSTYGSTALTKHLEEFSRDSLIFENCISTSSHTQPVHATLFTGLFQNEHGCHGDLNAQAWNFGAPPPRPLSEKFTTLAEIFRNSGYNTGAVVANSTLSDNGWKQGFDTYDCCRSIGDVYRKYPFHPIVHLFSFVTNVYPKYMVAARRADDINQGALAFIDSVASSRFFLFLNYMEAHSPYCAPRPFAGYYLDTPFPQLYRLEQFLRYITRSQDKATFDAYQLSQYDRAIAYLDDQLGKLFARMKRLGIYDESIIIITSDHGELFGEHDLYFHSCPMYEGVMRVPLLIKFPNSERVGRVKNVIQPTDIFATILSVGGLSIPDGISGKAFGNTDEPAVGEFENYAIRQHRVLYDGPYKYMKYEKLNNPELYDLTLDPSEKDNLAEKLPAVVHAMEKKLQAWESQHPPRYPVAGEKKETITGETLEGLKALGYIH